MDEQDFIEIAEWIGFMLIFIGGIAWHLGLI